MSAPSPPILLSAARGKLAEWREWEARRDEEGAGAGRWMGPVGFTVFLGALVAGSWAVRQYVDRPVSQWVAEKVGEWLEASSSW